MRQLPLYDELMSRERIFANGFIDKLFIHTHSIRHNFIKTNFKHNYFDQKEEDSHYMEGSQYEHRESGKVFFLLSGPFFKNVEHPYFIQINPSQFGSYEELVGFLRLIMGRRGFEAHHLTRVDVSIRLPRDLFPIHLFRATTYFRWKRGIVEKGSKYSNGYLSGYYSGKSKTLRVSIYDVDIKNRQLYGKVTDYRQTNFELQARVNFLKKNGIRMIGDLPKMTNTDLFKRLSFVNTIEYKASILPERREKFVRVQQDLLDGGYHNARIRLNKECGRNFNRNYRGVLRVFRVGAGQESLRGFLAKSFKKSFLQWCGADSIH
nr:hypothetical protein BdHM001_10060 [Bdellovibrio sp. HM001]